MEEVIQEAVVIEPQPAMTDESLGYLKTSAGWAQFLAIVNFVYCGILILGGLMMLGMSFVLPRTMRDVDELPELFGSSLTGASVLLALLYFVLGGIGFLLAYYLLKFSTDAKSAVLQRKTEFLTSSMGAMKKYFKLSGILTIVILVMFFLWLPIAMFMMPQM